MMATRRVAWLRLKPPAALSAAGPPNDAGLLLARGRSCHSAGIPISARFSRRYRASLDAGDDVRTRLLDEFLKLPHTVVRQISLQIGDDRVVVGHFDHLPVHCKYIALMPQWDFLNFLAEHGKRYQTFDLRMRAEATDLIEENGCIAGVRAQTLDGEIEIRADLVVGCDGRHSIVREKGSLESDDYGAPMDVMWFRLSRQPGDSEETFGHIEGGRMMVMLNRNDYWQCAYVIPKGTADAVKRAGLDKFRQIVGEMSPFMRDRLDEIESWDKVKLLTVAIDRLRQWYRAGLLCIGDAAHAMSPIGGVGINLAVQDAVAAANILAQPLRDGAVTVETLNACSVGGNFPRALRSASKYCFKTTSSALRSQASGRRRPFL